MNELNIARGDNVSLSTEARYKRRAIHLQNKAYNKIYIQKLNRLSTYLVGLVFNRSYEMFRYYRYLVQTLRGQSY